MVHHLASEDSPAKEAPSVLRMLGERVDCVAEIVAVCTLDRGIRE